MNSCAATWYPADDKRAGPALRQAEMARPADTIIICENAWPTAEAHGRETREVLVEARAVDRGGTIHVLPLEAMQLTYRHCGVPDDWIFTEALFQGTPGAPADILKQMEEVAEYREANQPIKERTGGSTFKNPPVRSLIG